jgi:hypothetical protein
MRTDTRADEVRRLVRTVFERMKVEGGRRKALAEPVALARKAEGGRHWRSQWHSASPAPVLSFPRPLEIAENVVIDRGRCVARSYRSEGYLAMWLIEVGILQFYNAEGDMLATINLLRRITPQRMAA